MKVCLLFIVYILWKEANSRNIKKIHDITPLKDDQIGNLNFCEVALIGDEAADFDYFSCW